MEQNKQPERKRTANGHLHGEAFMLMMYECSGRHIRGAAHVLGSGRFPSSPSCGHKEIYWNSRDGVTPFGKMCPSCGGNLQHMNWRADVYAPNHKPHPGQGIWRDGTPDEAEKFVRQRLAKWPSNKGEEYDNRLIELARTGGVSEFQKGWPMFYRHDPSQEG